jgi:hypothetical protein
LEFSTHDARHDLWVHSPEAEATLVWDRHNLMYAYGPLEQFRAILKVLQAGQVNGPPYPHAHMYHADHDDSERKLLRHFQWSRSPLIAGDEQ